MLAVETAGQADPERHSACRGRQVRGKTRRAVRRMRGSLRGDRHLTRLRCYASHPPSPTRGEGKRHHIGGVIPSRPTLTRLASSVPSSFVTAPKMMIFAPGFSSDLSPATNVTIGVPSGTTTFFSPSLYLTRMFWPSVPFTVWATVALVMVEFGRWSQGLKPSAAPRWFSGKICTATAFWVPSGSGTPVTPMYEPSLISDSVVLATP